MSGLDRTPCKESEGCHNPDHYAGCPDIVAELAARRSALDRTLAEGMSAEEVFGRVMAEYDRATAKFGAFNSGHEGYAVIAEELDELWDDVKRNDIAHACAEAIQVAAMGVRFVVDMTRERRHD